MTNLEQLRATFMQFREANRMKKFMSVIRNSMNAPWFNARDLEVRFNSRDYSSFLNHFFGTREDHRWHAYKTWDDQLLGAAVIAFKELAVKNEQETSEDEIQVTVKCDDVSTEEVKKLIDEFLIKSAKRVGEAIESLVDIDTVKQTVRNNIEQFMTETKNGMITKLNQRVVEANERIDKKFTSMSQSITELVNKELEGLKPTLIKIGERPDVKIQGKAHVALKECLELTILEKQVFISGPAGTGKTTLANQVAAAMELPFGHISCTLGLSESHLLGRMNAQGEYLSAAFVDIFENGGLFLFDEVDAADANTMLIINSALANGILSIPNRKDNPKAVRHEKFYCICAANTWGFGSAEYAGRNLLDAAFLDRFVASRMEVLYDRELEISIAGQFTKDLDTLWAIRENVLKSKIKRIVSTRTIPAMVRARLTGKTMKEYVDRFMTGWTHEEKIKALQNINLK